MAQLPTDVNTITVTDPLNSNRRFATNRMDEFKKDKNRYWVQNSNGLAGFGGWRETFEEEFTDSFKALGWIEEDKKEEAETGSEAAEPTPEPIPADFSYADNNPNATAPIKKIADENKTDEAAKDETPAADQTNENDAAEPVAEPEGATTEPNTTEPAANDAEFKNLLDEDSTNAEGTDNGADSTSTDGNSEGETSEPTEDEGSEETDESEDDSEEVDEDEEDETSDEGSEEIKPPAPPAPEPTPAPAATTTRTTTTTTKKKRRR